MVQPTTPSSTPQVTYTQRLGIENAQWDVALNQFAARMRVAIPGIIQSFDATKQTATVQIALREKVFDNYQVKFVEIAPLQDVPVILPRAGNFVLTMPIQLGDECLLIFSDMCIDSWWWSGDVQDQAIMRRHALSDAMAIMGCWSQPNIVPNYNMFDAELRNLDGDVKVTVSSNEVHVKAPITYVEGVLNNSNGASGTFTTPTGQTVTIQNGIVTQIL